MEPSNEEAKRKLLTPLLQRKLATGNPIRSKDDLNYAISENPKVKKVEQLPWSTGLFGCFSDFRNCCITCWCPWITFGQIAEIVDEGTTSCAKSGALYATLELATGCSFLYTCLYRHHIRQQYAVEEGPCNDCLVHLFCKPCALCQEYRELQTRGFDPSLGCRGIEEEIGHGELRAPTPPVIGAEKTPAK